MGKLKHTSATYKFALLDCKATVGATEIALYDGFCPNTDASVVGIERQDSESFFIDVFRVGIADTLTFTCTVAVYPSLPDEADCDADNNDSRRRRDAEEASGTTEITTTVLNIKSDKTDESSAKNTFLASTLFMTV